MAANKARMAQKADRQVKRLVADFAAGEAPGSAIDPERPLTFTWAELRPIIEKANARGFRAGYDAGDADASGFYEP